MDKISTGNLIKRVKSNKNASEISHLSRRQFLIGAAVISLFGPDLRAKVETSKVVRIGGLDFSNALTTVVNLKSAVIQGIAALIGKPQDTIPWNQIFPSAKNVSMKIDTRSPLAATKGELISALLELLYDHNIDPWKVTVWDKRIADIRSRGYDLKTKIGKHEVTATELTNQPKNAETGYNSRRAYKPKDTLEQTEGMEKKPDQSASYITNLIPGARTTLINVPTPKHNPLTGIDGALFSLATGSFSNTARFHESSEKMIESIVGLLKMKPFSNRILTIMDATDYVFEGGPVGLPAWKAQDNSLFIGFDPVAVDAVALEMIDRKRVEVDLPSIAEAGSALLTAAEEAGLGSKKPELIRLQSSRN